MFILIATRIRERKPLDLCSIAEHRKTGDDKRDWPYRRVQFRDSKETILIQLTDILSGALVYHLNGHRHENDASPAKCALSDHILQSAGVRDVFRDTAIRGKFTIWHRRLQDASRSPRLP